MVEKSFFSETRLYYLALIAALAILFVINILSFRQSRSLQKSADLVNHTTKVTKEINAFFTNMTLLRSAGQNYLLTNKEAPVDSTMSYRQQSEDAIWKLDSLTSDNPRQQENITVLNTMNEVFLQDISQEILVHKNSATAWQEKKRKSIAATLSLADIHLLKNEMITEENRLLAERKTAYDSTLRLTPLATFSTLFFSLFIFCLAFWGIMQNRKKVLRTGAFLENVLKSTSNIVSHFIPLRDADDKIYDFEIAYTNDRIIDATGNFPEDIQGKKISEVYPLMSENGLIEILIACVSFDKTGVVEQEYEYMGEAKLYKSTAIKYMDGVTLTSRNITDEKLVSKNRENFTKTLAIKNKSLKEAEIMAEIGSYRIMIATGKMAISDNFYRLLGSTPNEFELTYDKYLSFIHPDDHSKFVDESSKSVKHKSELDQSYRIVDKAGTVRELRATGKYTQIEEREALIGIVQDTTADNRRKQHLIDQNIDLRSSNEELESFNQIVSHDLQEPLRKVQMFISAIEDNENLYDEDQDYFKKIDLSAHRMRFLINNLLTYSEISKTHDNFEAIDLDITLTKVLEDQSRRIEQDKVKLTIGKLPIIQGVPFQMEQLFNNLISNAIKYGKKDGPKKIIVKSETAHLSELPPTFHKKFEDYIKISVIDNGIGFDQQYVDKIFQLFQRLHGKNAYSGSGLGLAICKKIVENHYGLITATATEDKGATFIIYLPA